MSKDVPVAEAGKRPNVVIVMSDDQRWDKITPRYTPNIYAWSQQADSVAFTNAFVTNPLCCPSRTTVLSGRYSHTTGVWANDGRYGGFSAFNDKHTLAVDFQDQGYRTALVGKYLNGYRAGRTAYVPPGWSKWFASGSGVFYNWGVTTNHKLLHFGTRPKDYSTRVLQHEAVEFVTKPSTQPFFLYFALTAPHGPAIPDPRDIGRFDDENDFHYNSKWPTSALESAYGVDRAFGALMNNLPPNTIVLYMSDNGYMWNDQTPRGNISGKLWPYNESIRVPIIIGGLNNAVNPLVAQQGDIVANVDLRTTLLHAAGLAPLTSQEGINWFEPTYAARDHLLIEHYTRPRRESSWESGNPTYCGIREKDWMYARFHEATGSYTEELYHLTTDPLELINVASSEDAKRQVLRDLAMAECDPAPPGYTWDA